MPVNIYTNDAPLKRCLCDAKLDNRLKPTLTKSPALCCICCLVSSVRKLETSFLCRETSQQIKTYFDNVVDLVLRFVSIFSRHISDIKCHNVLTYLAYTQPTHPQTPIFTYLPQACAANDKPVMYNNNNNSNNNGQTNNMPHKMQTNQTQRATNRCCNPSDRYSHCQVSTVSRAVEKKALWQRRHAKRME
jgi:hypothetical protein